LTEISDLAAMWHIILSKEFSHTIDDGAVRRARELLDTIRRATY
jgi:hypothetical protein